MSLYPLWLNVKVALKKGAIAIHLIHLPTFSYKPTWSPLKGVCARYHADVDGSPTTLVVRAAVKNGAQLQAILDSGVKVIALVEALDGDIVASIGGIAQTNPPNLLAIELGNEIDLTGTQAKIFNQFLSTQINTLRTIYGFRGDIITGGISRVRPDTLSWLKTSLDGLPTDILVGIHRYSIDNDATIPQTGYVNRDDESNAIVETCNGRSVAITEFGYPILDGSTKADVVKVTTSVKVDLNWWSKIGVKYALYYQWLNGPNNTPLERFGIQNRPDILGLLT